VHLVEATLRDFRNYREATLALEPGASLILGRNAQGKTNLLEALYYLGALHSFRGARPPELTRAGAEGFFVAGRVAGTGWSGTLAAEFHPRQTRTAVDGRPASAGHYHDRLRAVIFGPDDVALATNATLLRRYLDRGVIRAEPRHLDDLQRARRVLEHRNALLKRGSPAGLEAWDAQLAELYVAILRRRREATARLGSALAGAYAELAPDPGVGLVLEPSAPEVAQALDEPGRAIARAAEALRARRGQELRTRSTAVGPHRDGAALLVDGREARRYASRGQARTAAIALRLVEFDEIVRLSGEAPVLLLDDAGSELDEERRGRLWERAARAEQVLVTSAGGEGALPGGAPRARFEVAAGTIKRA
jgi:DNA replication and repair protein RecF